MKKALLVLALLSAPFFCRSQNIFSEPEESHINDNELYLSFIELDGKRYKNVRQSIFNDSDGRVTICLSCNNPVDNMPLHEIYLTLGNGDDKLPEMAYFKWEEGNDDQDMDIFFIRNYTQWNGAYHRLEVAAGNIYFQKFSETEYLLSGELKLDSRNNENIRFIHYGTFDQEIVEVTGIVSMSSDDIYNNTGKLLIDGKEVQTDYGFQGRYAGNNRYYIADRLLMLDRKIDYAIFFDSATRQVPIGKFTDDDKGELIGVGLFDSDMTIVPDKYEITIKYDKKKKNFRIVYNFILPDGRSVTGDYTGRFAVFPKNPS